jgi:hypothetical protein
MLVFRDISFSRAVCAFRWGRWHLSNSAMRYVASPILSFLKGVHGAGLADEDASAAPSQQTVHSACEIAAAPTGTGQLSRARRLLATLGGLPAARLQRAATLNPRTGISRIHNSPRAGTPEADNAA